MSWQALSLALIHETGGSVIGYIVRSAEDSVGSSRGNLEIIKAAEFNPQGCSPTIDNFAIGIEIGLKVYRIIFLEWCRGLFLQQ